MILAIHYSATYSYAAPVSLSVHDVRVFPRLDGRVRLRSQAFGCEPAAIRFRRDAFDNIVANCFFPEPVAELPFVLALEVEVCELNPFDFLLEERAVSLPIGYSASEQRFLRPFLEAAGSDLLPPGLVAGLGRPTVEMLVGATGWIHERIRYERREEGPPLPVAETLARGRGSCRDVSMLLLEALRRSGIAARLAAGFVWEGDAAEHERRAESAMHAWVEAYLPGAGWIGLDPTNGVLCDHHFVTVAVGLTPADIAAVNGTYFHHEAVPGRLTTSIRVTKR